MYLKASLMVLLQKRMQTLPLRISEASRRWPAPSAIPTGQHSFFGQPGLHTVTPSDSDSEDAANAGIYAPTDHLQQTQQQSSQADPMANSPPTFYMEPELGPGEDMDMMIDTPEPNGGFTRHEHQAKEERRGHSLQPGSTQPDPIGPPTITGRMPTPIQPSFASQIRGGTKNWSGAAGNIMATPLSQQSQNTAFATHSDLRALQQGLPGFQGSATEVMPGAAVPRSLDSGMADWSLIQNRRLPSPISESGGEGDSGQSSSGMAMDSNAVCHDYYGSGRGLTPGLPPRASSAMEIGGSSPAVNVAHRVATPHVVVTGEHAGEGSMDVEATTPSPPRKGHSRSRHTVNNWTQQPGMKKSFSIGYRSDCEKCRLKVPGHFNHIIIS